ncbi:hypothetical protein [Dactylosporangium sp. CA-233914]|uniref:hypothetical protein n=1 Tax=Dactylosporangium sp. CA-233914 TaxID=3239934 RepID=UPI003D8B5903
MLHALLLTLAVEVPLYTALLPAPWRRALTLGVLVNLVTHPPLWLLLTHRPGWLWPAEVAATTIEALILILGIKADKVRTVTTAVAANAASLLIGALI